MKPIEANDQAKLSWSRCTRLALSGMSYRMLRSGITTAILALAVAFLVYSVSYSIVAERTRAAAWEELRPTRSAVGTLSRLAAADPLSSIRRQLAGDQTQALQELRGRFSGSESDWQETRGAAQAFMKTQRWFDGLSPAASAVLLGGRGVSDWFDEICAAEGGKAYEIFVEQALSLGLGPSWTQHAEEAGNDAIVKWNILQSAARAIQANHSVAVQRLQAQSDRPMLDRLADPTQASTVREQVADGGFQISDTRWRELVAYARHARRLVELENRLRDPATAQAARQRWGGDDSMAVLIALRQPENAKWWDAEFTAEWRQTAERNLREKTLAQVAAGYDPAAESVALGLAPGTLWLIGLSLLVCVVGVTNALLMSVTERFNEIATMKCLGAMDGSVMRIFVIEALVQGLLGGVIGMVLGLTLALLRSGFEFGSTLTLALDAAARVLGAAGISWGVGVLLATLAAVLPSWIASRLSPMEAMRVE